MPTSFDTPDDKAIGESPCRHGGLIRLSPNRGIMMPLHALPDPNSDTPAMIPGYGPLPADLARDMLSSSHGRKWWRRLFTAPASSKKTSLARVWVGTPAAAATRAGSPT